MFEVSKTYLPLNKCGTCLNARAICDQGEERVLTSNTHIGSPCQLHEDWRCPGCELGDIKSLAKCNDTNKEKERVGWVGYCFHHYWRKGHVPSIHLWQALDMSHVTKMDTVGMRWKPPGQWRDMVTKEKYIMSTQAGTELGTLWWQMTVRDVWKLRNLGSGMWNMVNRSGVTLPELQWCATDKLWLISKLSGHDVPQTMIHHICHKGYIELLEIMIKINEMGKWVCT